MSRKRNRKPVDLITETITQDATAIPEIPAPMLPAPDKIEPPQIIVKPPIYAEPDVSCHRCGAVNQFRQTCGMRNMGAFHQAHGRCRKCGAIVKIRRKVI